MEVEPQEVDALLGHYRQRYHQMVQNAAYQDRGIPGPRHLGLEVDGLTKQLQAATAREKKLQQENAALKQPKAAPGRTDGTG